MNATAAPETSARKKNHVTVSSLEVSDPTEASAIDTTKNKAGMATIGISRIRFTYPATSLTVRTIHLHHLNTSTSQEPGETNTPRTGALHPNLE